MSVHPACGERTGSTWHCVVKAVRKMPASLQPSCLPGGWMAEALSPFLAQTLLSPRLPLFLPFKQPFRIEGWENFLFREGTSLIWASSPSTFLTRDPFKANGPPWCWHPSLSLPSLLLPARPPWFFFFSVLSSHPHCSVIDGDTLSTTLVTTHTHTETLTQIFPEESLKLPCAHLLFSAWEQNTAPVCHTEKFFNVSSKEKRPISQLRLSHGAFLEESCHVHPESRTPMYCTCTCAQLYTHTQARHTLYSFLLCLGSLKNLLFQWHPLFHLPLSSPPSFSFPS